MPVDFWGRAGVPILGPDLTFVASRFGPRDLLEHLLVPSKVIDGKYRQTIVETKSGH